MTSYKIKRITFDFLRGRRSLSFAAGSRFDSYSASKLLNSCFKSGKVREAEKVFDEIPDRNVVFWSIIVHGYAFNGFYRKSVESFSRMRISVLGDSRRGRQIHAQAIVHRFESELPLTNSLISMYSKCSDLDYSKSVFCQMNQKSIVSWTAMISGYLWNGHPAEALNLYMKFRLEADQSLDSAMIINALTACGEVAAFELCKQFHSLSFKTGLHRYRHVQNSLLSAYSNCGNMEFAYKVFKEMGNLQNVISWNSIINGYGINGFGETALARYNEMRQYGEKPDTVTYSCVLSACSHSGLINEGLTIINQMLEEGNVNLENEHYGCLVDMLARAGCLSEASAFIKRWFDKMGPNVLRALLSGCLVHGNAELAELIAARLFEVDPEDPGQVVLLSNVYASVGRFEDAEKLRMEMLNQGIRKNPGISFSGGCS